MRAIYITVMCVSAMFISLSAQDLNKEITIEKEIVPEQRSATKLEVLPQSLSRSITKKIPSFRHLRTASEVSSDIATLEPVSCGDTLKDLKYRGYVDAGYFPMFNASLSAGYRILDTDKTRLNTWMQYNGKVYDADMLSGDELTLRSHAVELGVGLVHKINHETNIIVGVNYLYNHYNVPMSLSDSYNENVNDLNLEFGWNSLAGVVKYNVGVEYNHFAYGHKTSYSNPKISPARENLFKLKGSAVVPYSETMDMELGVETSIVHDYGVVALTPHVDYGIDNLRVSAGVKIDVSINESNALNIAPDVNLNWIPVSYFSLYGKLGGGKHVNELKSLFDYSKYLIPMFTYGTSTLPFTSDVGVVVGPWFGAYVELFGGYAKADDWLMPCFFKQTNFYVPTDISGWHGGVEIGYNYRDIVDFSIRYETASQDMNKGYYLWRDRAKNVIDVSLQVVPINALDLTLGYEIRKDRYCISDNNGVYDLGDAENLSLGANYRLSEVFSVFGIIENLLNSEYLMNGNIPAQGITGLVGVNYQF